MIRDITPLQLFLLQMQMLSIFVHSLHDVSYIKLISVYLHCAIHNKIHEGPEKVNNVQLSQFKYDPIQLNHYTFKFITIQLSTISLSL